MIIRIEKGILIVLYGDNFGKFIHHQLCKIQWVWLSEHDFIPSWSFGRNIKDTTVLVLLN